MRKLSVSAVTLAVHVTALGCLGYLATHYSVASLFSGSALLWLVLNLIASYSVIPIYSKGTPSNVSAGFTIQGAILVMFNPLVAALLIAVGSLNERDFKRLRTLSWTLYNRSMYVVAATAGSLLYERLPGPRPNPSELLQLAPRVAAMTLAFFIVNTFLVRARVAALDNESFLRRYPFKGDLLVGYLFQGLVATILVVVADSHPAYAVLFVGPLWGIRFALEKIVQLRELNEQLVHSFADALDMRDHDTAGHTRRVATAARLIGQQLRLPKRVLDDIYAAGSLHDLGKIGIPDSILLKPGTLDHHEWDEMKRHPVMGANLLAPYRHLGHVTDIMRHHHERWDGKGYPDKLGGEDIPIGARVIAVADTFMVITDGRQYRAARTLDEAVAEIKRCSGSQFDPRVVDAFLALDPTWIQATVTNLDGEDPEPVLQSIAPGPIWSKLLGFKLA